MMALFPRDKNVCTKIQIHVQLRRCAPQEGRVSLKVVLLDAEGRVGETERESRPIPMEGGHADVRKEMQELLELEHGLVKDAGQLVCTTRAIVLEIESPTVPSIDLIDMPGLNAYGEKQTSTPAPSTCLCIADVHSPGPLHRMCITCIPSPPSRSHTA